MKKMLQILSIIGLISTNIGYANWWQDYQNYLKRQQTQTISTEKPIQATPVQKADWITRLKQWFTPKPGPEYRKLHIIDTKNTNITGKDEIVLALPFKSEVQLKEETTYPIKKIGKKYYLRITPTSKTPKDITEISQQKPSTTASAVGVIPLQDIKGKTYITPEWWGYKFTSFKPTPKLYPESEKTQKLFKKYGGGWE